MSRWGWIRVRRFTAYDAVRVALGLLLLVAAVLKGQQLSTQPFLSTALLDSRWVLIGIVQFELLSNWLLTGVLPEAALAVAGATFAAFAGVSLYQALSGASSCGCFGRVNVHPGWTFAMDAAAAGAILCVRRRTQRQTRQTDVSPRYHLVLLGLLWACTVIVASPVLAVSSARAVTDLGEILPAGRGVVLKPEFWSGKRFPLFGYVVGVPRLDEGKWRILLYHFDCPACREAIARYRQLAQKTAAAEGSIKFALIEIPPYAPVSSLSTAQGALVRGRLSDATAWFARTPIECIVDEGIVTNVRSAGK